jgi:hypothetical protein
MRELAEAPLGAKKVAPPSEDHVASGVPTIMMIWPFDEQAM